MVMTAVPTGGIPSGISSVAQAVSGSTCVSALLLFSLVGVCWIASGVTGDVGIAGDTGCAVFVGCSFCIRALLYVWRCFIGCLSLSNTIHSPEEMQVS